MLKVQAQKYLNVNITHKLYLPVPWNARTGEIDINKSEYIYRLNFNLCEGWGYEAGIKLQYFAEKKTDEIL